jgi:peptide/nickel transport system substrate-binding protein
VRPRRTLAAAVAAACLAFACTSSDQRAGARDAVLRLPLINDPILNPVIAPDIGSVLINKVIFPGLLRPDEQLRPQPDLALSWTASEDGLEYTFHLRPGVRWHDGQPFSARDVKFTFEQILDVNSGSRLRSDFASIAAVDVVDSLTVRFRLRAPFAPFLALLGYNAGILPAHAFAGGKPLSDAADFNRAHPVGTGPFRVVQSAPGSAIVLERNPDYYGARPQLDRLVFKIVPDVNAQVAQLRAGELDIILIEPANVSSLERARDVELSEVPVTQHYYVGFNQRQARFAAPLVRRALDYAVNRAAIIDGVLRGRADAPLSTIPIVLEGYFADTLARARYDRDSALALLAQAGWRADAEGKLRDAGGAPFAFGGQGESDARTGGAGRAARSRDHRLRRDAADAGVRGPGARPPVDR